VDNAYGKNPIIEHKIFFGQEHKNNVFFFLSFYSWILISRFKKNQLGYLFVFNDQDWTWVMKGHGIYI